VLFGVTASLIITSFALLTVNVLAQNIIEYHISSSLMMPAIFISGIILTIFTRNYWSLEKLQAIKSLAMYGILGETFLLSLGEAISSMADVEIWVRGYFLSSSLSLLLS
jgi:Ca2+/Na+ antiporter